MATDKPPTGETRLHTQPKRDAAKSLSQRTSVTITCVLHLCALLHPPPWGSQQSPRLLPMNATTILSQQIGRLSVNQRFVREASPHHRECNA